MPTLEKERKDMSFTLSTKSLKKLNGVNESLERCVKKAIELTKVDFGVICGLRTLAEQQALVDKGASQTLKSKHLDGLAVDLMAYVGGRASWELNLYDDIADAMKEAAKLENVGIRWGAAWHIDDIRTWNGTMPVSYTHLRAHEMQDAMNAYIDLRRSQGRRPFIDGPHFELA